jgi:hypothetical protein
MRPSRAIAASSYYSQGMCCNVIGAVNCRSKEREGGFGWTDGHVERARPPFYRAEFAILLSPTVGDLGFQNTANADSQTLNRHSTYAHRRIRDRASQERSHAQILACSISTRFKQWIGCDVQQRFSSFAQP